MSNYYIDSHCHLHDPEFFSADEAEKILKRAREKNVQKIVCIGTCHEDSLAARDFAAKHNNVFWTYGVHPNDAEELLSSHSGPRPAGPSPRAAGANSRAAALRNAPSWDDSNSPVAIGEVGLDYHYDGFKRELQIDFFEEMLQLATDNDLPVSFHIREAFNDFFGVIANFPKIRGVVHSFSDSKKNLKKILNETDFYVGVNGLATYSTLPTPPLERTLLETDAPFLAPVPYRGSTNEPTYIPNVAEWLAQKLAVNLETVRDTTTKNCETLFNLSK